MQGDGLQSSRGDGSEGDPQEKRQLYYPNGQPIPKGPYEDMSDRAFRALVDSIISTNQRVRHIMQAMTKLGCHVDKNFVQVEVCDEAVSGGYRPPDGVVLCKNHLSFEKDIATTMQHELIHAFDSCRARNLDWDSCEHHACSEVRAAALSGDCDWDMEVRRGNYSIIGQWKRCVRRRAELSVSMKAACQGPRAKEAVDAVLEKCIKDTAPFHRTP